MTLKKEIIDFIDKYNLELDERAENTEHENLLAERHGLTTRGELDPVDAFLGMDHA